MKILFLPTRPSINRAHRAKIQIRLTDACLIYGIFLTLLAGAQEPTPAAVTENVEPSEIPVTTNGVSLSVIDTAWDVHLAETKDPETHEWKLRARLERNPLDSLAIHNLITHFWNRGERAMAVSALQYAVHAGLTDDTKTHKIWTAEQTRLTERNTEGKKESDPYVEVRVKWFEETLTAGKKLPVLMKVYGDMELEIRDLIEKSKHQQQLLHALAQQYHHRGEQPMAAMTALTALQLDPANPMLIDQTLNIVEAPGYEPLLQGVLRFFSKRDDLKLPEIQRFAALSEQHGLKSEIIAFYQQASLIEPYNPINWQRMGETLFKQRDYRGAVKILEHATKLADHDYSIYHTLAVILHHSGDERNMVYWLQRWRNKVDEDQLIEALLNSPFNQYPKLLSQLE